MSMAVGEYVSVSSQRDAEHGDLAKETAGAFIAGRVPGPRPRASTVTSGGVW